MTSVYEDRTLLVSDVAIKGPCRAATTANIILNGEQTIDGVACVTGDRVLVKNQTSGVNNGIYLASTGSWTRTSDFDGNRDAVSGTLVLVISGTVSALALYELSCATSPPIIGTTTLTFNLVSVVVGGAGSFTTITASVGITGNLTGNVTGNVSGTAATVTGAAQAAITSVGVLTGLALSGAITKSGGGSLAITPSVAIGGVFLSIAGGATPASSGGIRVAADTGISARNEANSGDVTLIQTFNQNGVADVVLLGGLFGAGVTGVARSKAGVPTTSDVTAGMWAVWRDTSGATTKLYYNNAGTLQSVALT